MNKKRSKDNSKDQRRSKDAKWVRPKGYYCRYERGRRGEGKRIRLRTKALLTLLNDIYEPRSATGKRMISYLACLVDKEFRGHSYRSHVSYIESHQGLLYLYGLKKGSIKVVPAPRRGRICRLLEDTRDSVQAGKERRAGIPSGRLQRVLHNAVRGLGRRQAGDRI